LLYLRLDIVQEIQEQPAASMRAEGAGGTAGAGPSAASVSAMGTGSLFGVSLTMFLVFMGASSTQFHSYLFEQRGFAGAQAGYLLFAGYAAGILSPLSQVRIIRFFGGARLPLLLALAGTVLALAAIPFTRSFWGLLALFFACSFFASGVFPLNTACTLDVMRHRGHGLFFRIRSLGTIGFFIGCAVSAIFTDFSSLPMLYLGFAGAFLMALAVVAWKYPRGPGLPAAASGAGPAVRPSFARALRLLFEGRTGKLLIAMGAMNFANGLTLVLQGNYLVHRWEGGQVSISQAWMVSTACEVPIFALCVWILRRYGLRYVLALGLAGTLIKILGAALAAELWHYLLALAMHGFFFAGAITGYSVHLDRTHAEADRPSLQSLSVVFYQGIPNALAGLFAGLVWQGFSLRAVYFLAAGIALAATAYGIWSLGRAARTGR
jgi:MFS family permease